MNYSIYAESTPNPEVMKFVSNRMLADKSIEINNDIINDGLNKLYVIRLCSNGCK